MQERSFANPARLIHVNSRHCWTHAVQGSPPTTALRKLEPGHSFSCPCFLGGSVHFKVKMFTGAACLALAACGGDGTLVDNAAEAAEAQGANLEAMADNSSNEA